MGFEICSYNNIYLHLKVFHVQKPAETLKQISTVPEPSEKLAMKAAKIQSEKNFLINGEK